LRRSRRPALTGALLDWVAVMSTISSIRLAHIILVFRGAFAGRRKEFAHALRTGRERLTAVERRGLATASRLTLTLRRPRPDGAFLRSTPSAQP
jgi:hypothetical protein